MIKRDCENKLLYLAKHYFIVMVTGPRQSGKTTLCRHIFKNKPYVLLEDFDKQEFANKDPRGFLAQFPEGAVLDEVQKTPILINYLQGIVDSSPKKGLFILSGSQNLLFSKKVSQSLAGRTAILNLLPLTFNEVLMNHKVEKWEELALKGFFPRVYNEKTNIRELLSFYFRTYIDRDIRDLINVKNMITFQNFIKLCAGRVGQVINTASLGNDAGISHQTAREWLSILETSFILFRLPPYFKNFGKRIIKAPKLYFYDVGLLSYLLDIETVQHITNHPLRGNIFENLIVTDLVKQKYNNAEDHGLYYFRDSHGNEVDLLEHSNEAYRIMEIKSGLTINSDFFKGLDYFSKLETGQNVLKYLVYGGRENQKRTDYSILGYKSCGNFWK